MGSIEAIEANIVTVLKEHGKMKPFFLNKKVVNEYKYSEEVVERAIDRLVKDRIIIRLDDMNYNLQKYGKYSITTNVEFELVLNPEYDL